MVRGNVPYFRFDFQMTADTQEEKVTKHCILLILLLRNPSTILQSDSEKIFVVTDYFPDMKKLCCISERVEWSQTSLRTFFLTSGQLPLSTIFLDNQLLCNICYIKIISWVVFYQ